MRGARLLLLALFLVLADPIGKAAAPPKEYRMGVLLWHGSPNETRAWQGVKDGLSLAGMAWKADSHHEWVNVEGNAGLARRFLRSWEARKFDLVFAIGTDAALAARRVTHEVPVVFTAAPNPVSTGIVAAWDGSGTNLCGNSSRIAPADLFDAFQATFPGLARLGVVLTRTDKVSLEEVASARRYFEKHPRKSLQLLEEGVSAGAAFKGHELTDAVRDALGRGAQAIWIPEDAQIDENLSMISAVTMPRHIPLLASKGSAAQSDAVLGVTVDYRALGRKSVVYAKKILVDGADPGKLSIGTMQTFRVVVNLEAARRTGFVVPLPLLATADEIIDPLTETR